VRRILRDSPTAIPALNLAEAVDVLTRRFGVPIDRSRPIVEGLTATSLEVLPFDEEVAWVAARLRSSRYHRVSRPLSMADCGLLAQAEVRGAVVASTDGHVVATAREEKMQVIPLPPSS